MVVALVGGTSRPLNVSHGFHSPMMAPAVAAFQSEVKAVEGQLRAPSVPFFSTLLGREAHEEVASAGYWIDHIPGTVRFMAAMDALDASVQPEAYVEIGASPVLIGMAKRFVKGQQAWLPCLDPKDFLLLSLLLVLSLV